MKAICGIDVGGTAIKIGLFDEKMNLLEKYQIKTTENIFKDVAESLKTKNVSPFIEKAISTQLFNHQANWPDKS